MTWTTSPPSQEGSYWWRRNKFKTECMFYVFIREGRWFYRHSQAMPCDARPVDSLVGEWYGPLTPPE